MLAREAFFKWWRYAFDPEADAMALESWQAGWDLSRAALKAELLDALRADHTNQTRPSPYVAGFQAKRKRPIKFKDETLIEILKIHFPNLAEALK